MGAGNRRYKNPLTGSTSTGYGPLRRAWFKFRLRHRWARSAASRANSRRSDQRLAAASDLAQREEISLGAAIEQLYGGDS